MKNIVFLTDNNYVVPTIVAIKSLLNKKNSDEQICINIVANKVCDENKNHFQELEQKDAKINIINFDSLKLKGLHNSDCDQKMIANETALIKFCLPEIFNELDEILYLDGDLLILDDIFEIFKTDLKDNYAVVVRDLPQVLFEKQDFGEDQEYFNSGVMLLNLKQMRLDNISQQLIETKQANSNDSLMDQNVFNKVFKDKIIQLDIAYNVSYGSFYILHEFDFKKLSDLYNCKIFNLDDLKKHAKIIHFSSYLKPWVFYDVPFAKMWFETFNQTSLKNINLNRISSKNVSIEDYKNYISGKPIKKKKLNIIGVIVWPFKMIGKFFCSLFNGGIKQTIKRFKRKIRFIWNRLTGKVDRNNKKIEKS